MTTSAWHQLCTLRDDVRSGKLTLDEFAADLYDARTGAGPLVYRDPGMFFDRTYPTHRMKKMASEVLNRLAGQGGNPVLRLQVAYGGGKTHTLIALLHLANVGADLAEHPTVREFLTFAGVAKPPRARVALLPGDKIDVKEGLEVVGPTGQSRRVQTLWGALAYQLAGDVGYTRLQAHDQDFTIPAEPLLVDLLRAPLKEDLGSLVLVDEAVWYYRSLVNSDPRMLGSIKDFYQVLTQAVAKVERASMVASLIASRVEANDQTGVQCLNALDDIFRRIAEPVEPVTRGDVAEILRRRLFKSVPGSAERRPVVDAMMAALNKLPLHDTQRDQSSYDRYLESYPFHPDLINLLYQKWTKLDNFQRTRGALRLLANALRDSNEHDPAPFVGPSSFLPYGSTEGLSEALDEMVEILSESHKWLSTLTGELEKAREIQSLIPALQSREIEQAVVTTVMHSQPMGQRAAPTELLAMLAHPGIDGAALEEGLRKWRERSWFLVDNPDFWQLGTVPNLTHMHFQAKNEIQEDEISDELRSRIQAISDLKAADPGVEIHVLPKRPRDVDDNLRLHYLVLELDCAVTLGKPLPQAAEDYFNLKAGPRIYRNNILALAPESANVAGLREQVRGWLGWKRLEKPETYKLLTDQQKKELPRKKSEATNNLPEAVVGAYRLLLTVNEDGDVEAHTLRAGSGGTPFERIKALLIEEERLVPTTLDPDLLLPDSYFELWSDGQTAQRVSALIEAFGQFPRLPRLLRPESLYETLKRGVKEGVFVLRLPRPDGSAQTWWLRSPDETILTRPELEVQPASKGQIHYLAPELLKPDEIDGLWPKPDGPLTVEQLQNFFDRTDIPDPASMAVIDEAVRQAVRLGHLMARINGSSLYREDLPEGTLPDSLELYPPPARVSGGDLTTQALGEVWQDGQANLQDMSDAISGRLGFPVPWTTLSDAVNEALSLGLFEVTEGAWPCSPVTADQVKFQVIEKITLTPETVVKALSYTDSKTPTLTTIKETIEQQFFGGRTIPEDAFLTNAQSALDRGDLTAIDEWNSAAPWSVRVRQPDAVLYGETTLDSMGLQRLPEGAIELFAIAPELNFTFRVSLTAEGQPPDPETLAQLNKLLGEIQDGWKLSK